MNCASPLSYDDLMTAIFPRSPSTVHCSLCYWTLQLEQFKPIIYNLKIKGMWSYPLSGISTPFLSLIRCIAGRETGLYWRVTREGSTLKRNREAAPGLYGSSSFRLLFLSPWCKPPATLSRGCCKRNWKWGRTGMRAVRSRSVRLILFLFS